MKVAGIDKFETWREMQVIWLLWGHDEHVDLGCMARRKSGATKKKNDWRILFLELSSLNLKYTLALSLHHTLTLPESTMERSKLSPRLQMMMEDLAVDKIVNDCVGLVPPEFVD